MLFFFSSDLQYRPCFGLMTNKAAHESVLLYWALPESLSSCHAWECRQLRHCSEFRIWLGFHGFKIRLEFEPGCDDVIVDCLLEPLMSSGSALLSGSDFSGFLGWFSVCINCNFLFLSCECWRSLRKCKYNLYFYTESMSFGHRSSSRDSCDDVGWVSLKVLLFSFQFNALQHSLKQRFQKGGFAVMP